MNHLLLTKEPLDINEINSLVANDTCGAISLFVGTTRNNFDGRKVLSLEYESYDSMALKQMQSICDEIRARWNDVVNVVIYHRLGVVPVREASVVIAISSPHRQTAIDAVAHAIEELKRRVPIWKKEKYEDDESAWKENKECDWIKCKKKNINKSKLDFSECILETDEIIPQNLVQISATDQEIKRRVQCFVDKKREEIDINNIIDYTARHLDSNESTTENEMSSRCARTDSIIVKQEHSKSHLRVRRVQNQNGPQTRSDYTLALDNLTTATKPNWLTSTSYEFESPTLYKHVYERLKNIEDHIFVPDPNIKRTIFERLKNIENRLLYIESISPEYSHFMSHQENLNTGKLQEVKIEEPVDHRAKKRKRKTYSVGELNDFISII